MPRLQTATHELAGSAEEVTKVEVAAVEGAHSGREVLSDGGTTNGVVLVVLAHHVQVVVDRGRSAVEDVVHVALVGGIDTANVLHGDHVSSNNGLRRK